MGFTLYSALPASVLLCAECHDHMGELMQRVVIGPGPAGISLCMPGRADAALLQPVKISPKIQCVENLVCDDIPSAHFVNVYSMSQLQSVFENNY